jgi:hypothetical protein
MPAYGLGFIMLFGWEDGVEFICTCSVYHVKE